MVAFNRLAGYRTPHEQVLAELNWTPLMDRPERGHVDYRKHVKSMADEPPLSRPLALLLFGAMAFVLGWVARGSG
jgi:hypothetical protein